MLSSFTFHVILECFNTQTLASYSLDSDDDDDDVKFSSAAAAGLPVVWHTWPTWNDWRARSHDILLFCTDVCMECWPRHCA